MHRTALKITRSEMPLILFQYHLDDHRNHAKHPWQKRGFSFSSLLYYVYSPELKACQLSSATRKTCFELKLHCYNILNQIRRDTVEPQNAAEAK